MYVTYNIVFARSGDKKVKVRQCVLSEDDNYEKDVVIKVKKEGEKKEKRIRTLNSLYVLSIIICIYTIIKFFGNIFVNNKSKYFR